MPGPIVREAPSRVGHRRRRVGRLTNRFNRYIILKDRAEKPCFALFRRSAIGFDRFYLYRARNAYDTRARGTRAVVAVHEDVGQVPHTVTPAENSQKGSTQ